jgi:hypothetical protein
MHAVWLLCRWFRVGCDEGGVLADESVLAKTSIAARFRLHQCFHLSVRPELVEGYGISVMPMPFDKLRANGDYFSTIRRTGSQPSLGRRNLAIGDLSSVYSERSIRWRINRPPPTSRSRSTIPTRYLQSQKPLHLGVSTSLAAVVFSPLCRHFHLRATLRYCRAH